MSDGGRDLAGKAWDRVRPSLAQLSFAISRTLPNVPPASPSSNGDAPQPEEPVPPQPEPERMAASPRARHHTSASLQRLDIMPAAPAPMYQIISADR